MNIFYLIIGIILVVLFVAYFLDLLKDIEKDEDYDAISSSFDIQIIGGVLIFFIMGIIMVYRELKDFF